MPTSLDALLADVTAAGPAGGPVLVRALVDAALVAAEGQELPDGVPESLAAVRASMEAVAAPDGGERRASGMYARADAGEVQDDGTVILCTDGEARDGHILDVATLKLDHYKRNPVLYYNHASWSAEALPVGRIVPESIAEVTVGKGRGLAGRPEFHRATEQGTDVATLWDGGYLRCVSATWRCSPKPEDTIARRQLPIDHPAYKADSYGYLFKNAELVEMSVVGIPSDPAAERVRTQPGGISLGLDLDALTDQLVDGVAKRLNLVPPSATSWW